MDDSDSEEIECQRKYSNHSEVLLATVLLYIDIDSPMRMLFQELLIRIDKRLEQMERKQIHMEKRMEKNNWIAEIRTGLESGKTKLKRFHEYPTLLKSSCRKGRSGEGQRKCRFHCIVYQKCVLH